MKKLFRIFDIFFFGYDPENTELEYMAIRLKEINKIIGTR